MNHIVDRFGRRIRYVRLSVTEYCNYRCSYCTLPEGAPRFARSDLLQPAEYDLLIRTFQRMGVKHLRFTGGEPLIYPHLLGRVAAAHEVGYKRVSLSTNGHLLGKYAEALLQAGVNRINISMDSLRQEVFHGITGVGDLARVLSGLRRATEVGITDIKINVVLLRTKNFVEVHDFVSFAIKNGYHLQFIETMPLGEAGMSARSHDYVSVAEARARVEEVCELVPVVREEDAGPANKFLIAGTDSQVGFISPVSNHFCATCNRLRLTASGRLVYCLGQDHGFDLLPLVRDGACEDEIGKAIAEKVWREKPEKHFFNEDSNRSRPVHMMRLGG